MKLALLVAYDGTAFHGFARQPRARTVQGELERVLALILRAPVETVGAGRTDAGVHASGQVISFGAPEATDPERVRARLNKLLGPEIALRAAAVVGEDFSARFDARRRAYEYRCYRADHDDPFRDRFMLRIADVKLAPMRAAAKALVGEHDFSAFCRKGQGSLVRRVRRVAIVTAGDELTFKLEADSFCHQMVRSIVGLLLDIGRGKRAPGDVERALRARDRSAAGPVAPARGLHLVRVEYQPDPFA
jgi:tRNA pseudouridine38-40 synthase